MKANNLLTATALTIAALFASTNSFADSKAKIDASVGQAVKAFHLLDATHPELAKKATGILIFPRVAKGMPGIAGEYGEGVLQVKGKTVGYYNVASASIGLMLGVVKRSEIIMFMTQGSLDKFTASRGWSVGAGTGIALVSVDAGGGYDSKTLQQPILGFVFGEKGLIADLSLDGSKIYTMGR